MRRTRAILLSCILAAFLGAGLATPAHAATSKATLATSVVGIIDFDMNFEWDGFKKFWRRNLAKTAGVTGVVSIVVGIGVLIILSARKKT